MKEIGGVVRSAPQIQTKKEMRAARELRQSHPPRDYGVNDEDEELMRAIQASQLDMGGVDDEDDISM